MLNLIQVLLFTSAKKLKNICGLILILSCVVVTNAQTDTARLQGTITDTSGAALSGAAVTLTNLATSRSVTTQTNEEGNFTATALSPGRYKVEIKQDNFKSISQEITLEVSQVASMNFSLEPGEVSDIVTVSSDIPLVEAGTSAIGKVVQGRQVTELPLNGRNFTQLATLIPGVTRGVPDGQSSGAGNQAETYRYGNTGGAAISVNGLRTQANNFLLDGVDNNESLVNSIVIFPPAEAIQEFRVQTSVAPAEFGRAGGALISASIRSGSNEFHGNAFWFLRNDQLDARPTFTPKKSEFRRNQFGGALGGPIIKNKLFFFADYQGLRQFLPLGVDFATVPTSLMRQGNFSELLKLSNPIQIKDPLTGNPFPGNIIPGNRINPVAQRYLNAFPLPNASGNNFQKNYIAQRVQTQEFNDYDARVDWSLSSNDQMFGRWSQGRANSLTTSRLPNLPSGFGSGTQPTNTYGLAIGETHTFSPTIVNEFRFGFIRTNFGYTPPFFDKQISADLGIPNANTSPLLGGGALIGGYNDQIEYTGDFGLYKVPQNTFQYSDSLSINKGNHSIKLGANIIRRQVNLFRPKAGKGYFFIGGNTGATTGHEVSELLAGFVDRYDIGAPFGTVGTRNWETGYFVQDDWRVTRKLTLNLGLRYDLYTFPLEVRDRQANFDITTGELRLAGVDGNSRSLVPTDKNNFAPRVGFAYDICGNNKTVIRGGYGLFYFLDRGGIDNQLAQNAPFSGTQSFSFGSGARITLSGRAPDGSTDSRAATGPLPIADFSTLDLKHPSNVSAIAVLPTNVNSYVQQWNLQVQHQLNSETALSVAYVGTQGKKLSSFYNINRDVFNAPRGTRRFSSLGQVAVQETRGSSIYHSLQTQLERRLTKGWQFLASYTWSHAIDDSVGAFDLRQPQDINNFRLDRGNSSLDSRHKFIFSSLYEIPYGHGRKFGSDAAGITEALLGGWQINSILTLQSGFPFDLTTGGDPSDVRPDLIGKLETTGNPDNYFNTTAVKEVPRNPDGIIQRPGTAGRNILVGPGTKQLDFSIFKAFSVQEHLNIQFRTEFFNLTNTPQFSNPDGSLSSGNFGKIRGTRFGSNRQIQFALRVNF